MTDYTMEHIGPVRIVTPSQRADDYGSTESAWRQRDVPMGVWNPHRNRTVLSHDAGKTCVVARTIAL